MKMPKPRRRSSRRPRPSNARVLRRLIAEPLESRRLLAATDLAMIGGLVFKDVTGDGFTAGEQVSGAQVALYRDNGNGSFDSGTDTLVTTATTGTDGRYTLNRLTAGNYFVLQDAQTVDGRTLLRNVSPMITISGTDVEGRIVQVVDDFDQTQQQVVDTTNDGVPVTSSVAAPEAIGGERDLFVNKTSVNGAVQLEVDNPLLPNLLTFDSLATGDGERRVTWDGPDGDATTVDDTGLGTVDLTDAADAIGLQLQIGADLPGGQAVVRIYSDDGNAATAERFSSATLNIPQTGGGVSSAEFLPFSSFVAAAGGGVDINNVGAIELEITGSANVNGTAELVGTVGQTAFTADFDNFTPTIDLSLSKTSASGEVAVGESTTFTITINNAGPVAATGVVVQDVLPAGITLVSQTTSQGTYNATTGRWEIGDVAVSASHTLSITARMDTPGTKTNIAEVIAADQTDIDSTPGNGAAGEDDRATVSILSPQIDLSIAKTASDLSPDVGQNVTFTVTLSNAGPDTATGVTVRDVLPAGLNFVSATPSQGSYESGTGVWTVGSVNAGSGATLSIIAGVTAAGSIQNVAEVLAADQPDADSTPGNGATGEDDLATVTLDPQQIDLSLIKTVDNAVPNRGDNVTFTITLSNAGPSAATGVIVRDAIPAGLTFVSSAPSIGSYNTTTGQWVAGTVAAGTSQTLQLVARVDSVAVATNVAEVIAADQADVDSTPNNNVPAEDDQSSVVVTPASADLSLTKTIDNAAANVGQNATFTITVQNDGPSVATGVQVTDLLPAGMSFVSSSPSQGGYNAATGLWDVGTIGGGASATLAIVAQVQSSGTKTNTAQISAADQFDPDSTPGNNAPAEDDQASVNLVPPTIDLSLGKTVDQDRPNVGDTVRFTVSVSNAGPDAASGVVVRDVLPAGLTFVGATPGAGIYDVGTGQWNVGGVTSGQTVSLAIDATVTGTTTISNQAEVIAADQFDIDSTPGEGGGGEDDIASVSITPASADLSLTKTVDNATPNVGENVSFTVTVSNAGPDTATGVVVRDLLPAGLNFVSATPGQGTYESATGLWNAGQIASGATGTLVLIATVTSTDALTNTAEITAADQRDPDSTPGNGSASEDDLATVGVRGQQIDLSLTKTVDNAAPNVGDEITFTITVRNDGVSPATGVQVRDILPAGLTPRGTSPSQGSLNTSTSIWTVGDLAVGGTATIDVVVRVDQILEIENVAEVIAADQPDADSTPDNNIAAEDDQDAVTVRTPVSDLSLVKGVDNDRPNVGDVVIFDLTVTNGGPDPAVGVEVTDLLPEGIEYISNSLSQGSYNATTGIWTIGNLAVGSTATLGLRGRVSADAADPLAAKTNTAEITAAGQADSDSTPGNRNPDEDDFDQATITPMAIDLSLEKTVSDAAPSVGGTVTYTVTVRNDGDDPATGVQIRDRLPDGVTLVSVNESQGSFNAASGVWSVPQIDVGGSATLQLEVLVDSPGTLVNQAEVIAADQLDRDSTPDNDVDGEDDQADVTLVTQQADLSLTKTVDNATPGVGEEAVFTLEIRNDGPDAAESIVVRDVLPSGLGFSGATASSGSYNASNGQWSIPALAASQTATLQIRVTADSVGEKINVAEIIQSSEFDPDSTPDNGLDDEDDHATVALSPQLVDLALSKDVDEARPTRGQRVTFTLRLTNDGPSRATGVQVRDVLPDSLTFENASASVGSYSPLSGLWTIDSLDAGGEVTLAIEALVGDVAAASNVAEVIAADQPDADSTPDNDDEAEDDFARVDLETQVADLSVAVAADRTSANQGDPVIFTITLDNAGPDAATDVVVSTVLPAGLVFAEAQPSVGTYDPATGQWSVDSLVDGSSATLRLLTTIDGRDVQSVTAEVSSVRQFDPDSTPGNGVVGEDDLDDAAVTPVLIDVSVTGTIDNDEPLEGDRVTIEFNATNDGPDGATGLVLETMLPDGMSLVSVQAGRGAYDTASGTWNLGSLAAGQSGTLTFIAVVDERGVKTMPIEVVAADQVDIDSTPGNGGVDEDDRFELLIRAPRLLTKRLFLAR
ncbi:DUF11 domain-containing protein [Crateriforma spongiae]|uniref:DUF11 domain-containing protein n=1 Tax=Crateriforma spongiae TaxID=2724528 RepID=UPI0039B0F9A7